MPTYAVMADINTYEYYIDVFATEHDYESFQKQYSYSIMEQSKFDNWDEALEEAERITRLDRDAGWHFNIERSKRNLSKTKRDRSCNNCCHYPVCDSKRMNKYMSAKSVCEHYLPDFIS